MEIASTLGGIPALTAAVVVCTGIFGGIAGFKMMKLSHVKSPIARGCRWELRHMLSGLPWLWKAAIGMALFHRLG